MARVFFDANYFVDIVENRKKISWEDFVGHNLYISPLSVHILAYLYKYIMPRADLQDTLDEYVIFVPLDEALVQNALLGPTGDFEDNVQLHSAANAECDIFLTSDKKLLNLRFFGKTKVLESLSDK